MPVEKSDLPSTLKKSPPKAQRTFAKTLESAEETYEGDEERAYRTANAALKHTHEKVGDHWEPKAEPGPSDQRAKLGGARARRGEGETAGGVDVEGHTKAELVERAEKLGIDVKSRWTKLEIGQRIAQRQG